MIWVSGRKMRLTSPSSQSTTCGALYMHEVSIWIQLFQNDHRRLVREEFAETTWSLYETSGPRLRDSVPSRPISRPVIRTQLAPNQPFSLGTVRALRGGARPTEESMRHAVSVVGHRVAISSCRSPSECPNTETLQSFRIL